MILNETYDEILNKLDLYNIGNNNYLVESEEIISNLYESYIIESKNNKQFSAEWKKLKSDFSSGKSRLFSKEYKSIINSFESSLKLSAKVKYEDAIEIATALSGYQVELRNFKSLSNKVEPLFPFNYDGLKTDWDVLNSDLTALIKISRNSSNKAKFAVLSEMSNNEYLETKNRIIKINNFIASKYDT